MPEPIVMRLCTYIMPPVVISAGHFRNIISQIVEVITLMLPECQNHSLRNLIYIYIYIVSSEAV
jgi:hypothetical protein